MSTVDNSRGLEQPVKCPRCEVKVAKNNVRTWREEAYGRDGAAVICNRCNTEYFLINTPPFDRNWTLTGVKAIKKGSSGSSSSSSAKKKTKSKGTKK